jgi:hypothetical protein
MSSLALSFDQTLVREAFHGNDSASHSFAEEEVRVSCLWVAKPVDDEMCWFSRALPVEVSNKKAVAVAEKATSDPAANAIFLPAFAVRVVADRLLLLAIMMVY